MRAVAILALALALAGCRALPWLGGGDDEPPLEGTRIPVILTQEAAVADPAVASSPVTVPPATAVASWPQPFGDPSHTLGNIAGTGSLERLWSADIGASGSSSSPILGQPVMAEGKLFAMDGAGNIVAVSVGDGGRVWSVQPYPRRPDRLASGGVAYASGRLVATLANGDVVALAASDGGELWRASLKVPLRAAPTIAEDRVLIRTVDNQLLALDLADGAILWRHTGLFEPAGILGGAPPAYADGIVVVAYSSGEVFGLLLEDGRELWSETVLRARRISALDTITDITGAPVIDGDRVYVAGTGGETAAFDLRRGTRLWQLDLTSFGTPWVAGDFIYLVTERGELVCILRDSGRIRWVKPLSAAVGVETGTSVLWNGPIMVGGRLIVTSSRGDVAAFSAASGDLVAQASIGETRLSPIAAGGTIYVLTDGADIVAFR